MIKNSISGPTKGRRVKAIKTVGPIRKHEIYPLIEIKGGRYTVDVDGIPMSYPLSYFFYM
jgi:hypothetical protein